MTTETQEVATSSETQNQTTEATEKPEIVEPGSTDAEGDNADASAEDKPEKTAEQKELERLRRQLTKRDRTQGKLYQELETLREQQRSAQMSDGESPRTELDPIKLAREIAAIEKVTEKANAVAKDGNKRFTDFGEALETLQEEAGPLFDKRGLPTSLGEAILDADDPAALIQFFKANDDVAAELHGLSPTALGRRIARIEAQMNAAPKPKPASKASEPIAPLRGTANATVKSLEQMSQAEYEAHRAKQNPRWRR